MAYVRINALDQALDIAGSLLQKQTMVEANEPLGLGGAIANGTGATVTAAVTGGVTLSGLTGMTASSVGNFLTLSGAVNSGNNGTFLIMAYNSATSVDVSNPSGVSTDAGPITWAQYYPYNLQDDINYTRTDRKLIKGTTNWYDKIPVYQQPTAVGTDLPADLTHIATKTTDAVAYNVNRTYFGAAVAPAATMITVTSTGNLKHADPVNTTGIPCFDAAPFTGDYNSCYVHIVDGYSDGYAGSELVVLSGPNMGQRIFGVTYAGSSTSPNSVEVHFFSAPFNVNYAVAPNPYTWEAQQSPVVNLLYGYSERLDQLDVNAFRTVPALGILTDAALQGEVNVLATDVNNILDTMGTTGGTQNLNGLLTNITQYFPFFNLPNATPTVVDALNTLNSNIGNETYTGPVLTSGQTITASLQALSNAISASQISRTIERLTADIPPNTVHSVPGMAYTLDPTNNGLGLWVFTRGVLRHPGPVSSGNDYAETSTTSVTFYNRQKATDIIDYIVRY